MRTRLVALSAAALAVISLAGCSSGDSKGPETTVVQGPTVAASAPAAPVRVDAQTFSGIVTRPGVTVIDVRTAQEFASGHLNNAVNYDVEGPDFATQIAALDPAGIYAVYCRSGNRSQVAVSQMSQAGINGIYELESGISGWQDAGFPVSR